QALELERWRWAMALPDRYSWLQEGVSRDDLAVADRLLGEGRLRTVEGDDQFHEALFGSQAEPGKGRVVVFDGKGTQAGYRAAVSGALVRARELGAATRAVIAADGREDQVYAALCGRDEVLWLNYTPHKVKKGNKVLPPYSIVSQHVRAIAAGRHDGW
ncbi:MAG TPA: hypothetical protein PKO36_17340, partial [Candidatus Hydrogenedentes bacterium]|nr:hypothetical protein [Candidatus Hydrogenedentota bacterium]